MFSVWPFVADGLNRSVSGDLRRGILVISEKLCHSGHPAGPVCDSIPRSSVSYCTLSFLLDFHKFGTFDSTSFFLVLSVSTSCDPALLPCFAALGSTFLSPPQQPTLFNKYLQSLSPSLSLSYSCLEWKSYQWALEGQQIWLIPWCNIICQCVCLFTFTTGYLINKLEVGPLCCSVGRKNPLGIAVSLVRHSLQPTHSGIVYRYVIIHRVSINVWLNKALEQRLISWVYR